MIHIISIWYKVHNTIWSYILYAVFCKKSSYNHISCFLNFITVLIPSTSFTHETSMTGFPISQRLTQVEVPFLMATIRASPVWDIHHLYNPISIKSIFDDLMTPFPTRSINYLVILADPSFLCFWCFLLASIGICTLPVLHLCPKAAWLPPLACWCETRC